MPPLQSLLLKAMRCASLGAAMLLGAVWLFRAIGRELDNPGA